MARMPRIIWEFGLYHVTVRGNNKQQVFHAPKDFIKYTHFLSCYKEKFKFKLYAFVLMLNHLHLLIETTKYGSISAIMQPLNQRYAFWHNRKYEKNGHLWESRFYSNIIEKDSYLLECIRYIELNPVRSKIVSDPKSYKWSSYQSHAYNQACPILDLHPIFKEIGKTSVEIKENYKKFVKEGLLGTESPIGKVSVTKFDEK
jgi:putative transposase